MPTGGYQFITFVQGRQCRSTNDEIFLPQTQITAVRDRAKGSGLFQNVGRTFLKILDEEFPESHVFHKIFNRNTVKISYSCMPNLKQINPTENDRITNFESMQLPKNSWVPNGLKLPEIIRDLPSNSDNEGQQARPNLCGAHRDLV